MQHCRKPSVTSTRRPAKICDIPQYVHSVVMGVNTRERMPGNGAGFFLHATDGGPTAGCVAIDDGNLVEIIRWLRPAR